MGEHSKCSKKKVSKVECGVIIGQGSRWELLAVPDEIVHEEIQIEKISAPMTRYLYIFINLVNVYSVRIIWLHIDAAQYNVATI